MTPTAFVPLLGREFDGFLYAPIGEEKSEMTLTVASALARMDVDPWRESVALRDLPTELATRRLAALIEKLPAGRSGKFDEWAIARRLIALLPPAGGVAAVRRLQSPDFGSVRNPQLAIFIFCVASMLFALFVSESHQTQPTTHSVPVAVSESPFSKAPPP
jgi:hypothetical protein